MTRLSSKRRSEAALSLTLAQVHLLFAYDSECGGLRRLVKSGSRGKVGSVCKATEEKPYAYVCVSNTLIPLHHVVWFYHKGVWPAEYLGFKDGDSKNTRIDNLFEKTAKDSQAVNRRPKPKLTVEEKQDRLLTKMSRIRLRAIWRTVIALPHTWDSFDHFVATVKERPGPKTYLQVKDTARVLGPNNFQWAVLTQLEIRGRNKELRDADYDGYHDKWISKKFGVPRGWYRDQLAVQGGVCAICCKPETAIRKGKLLPLAVDHDHRTNAARGLLCSACNIGIGALQDDPAVIARASSYVAGWRKVHSEPLPDNVVSLKDHKNSA